MNMAGTVTEFGGVPRSNTLKVLGLELFSIGQVTSEDASFEEMQWEDEAGYFRFLLRDSRLVGAILLGDTGLAARVQRAMETREDFSQFVRMQGGVPEFLAYLQE